MSEVKIGIIFEATSPIKCDFFNFFKKDFKCPLFTRTFPHRIVVIYSVSMVSQFNRVTIITANQQITPNPLTTYLVCFFVTNQPMVQFCLLISNWNENAISQNWPFAKYISHNIYIGGFLKFGFFSEMFGFFSDYQN